MQTSQKTTPAILFLLIATTALVLSCTHARVFASQLPGDGITFPTLLPDPGQDVFVPIQTIDLHRATDIVWASILGTEEKDPILADLFDRAPILISGVMDIEGKEYLYLGVERTYHDRHGSKHIYRTLQKRFPGTPIYVEPSDGVELLQAETRSRENATAEDNTIFRDTFTDGLDKWTTESFLSDNPGWTARALDETGNIVAQTQDCPILCHLTTAEPLNLEDHETVQITFDRWIDKEVDNGEGLALNVGNNGIYRTVGQWREGDSAWRTETVTLRNLSGNVTIRFTAIPSSVFNADPKTIAVDNVTITQTPQETTEGGLTPRISAQPTEAELNQPITLSVTVQNTATATKQGTVRLYRHLSKTDTPTQGGTRLPQTADTGSIAPNGQATTTIQTTAPTPDTYHYYACIEDVCSATPATVTVREQETTETDTFSLSKTNASQNNVDAQSPLSLTTTVTNTGDTTTNPATVSFYLHERATATPNIGGTKIVQSARTKELAPNESETLSVTTVAQNVTATTIVRYYACIEDVCSATPATVTVREQETTETTETTDTFSLSKTNASQNNVDAQSPLSLTTTVTNTGDTTTNPATVSFYLHERATATPNIGGTKIAQSARTKELSPNESETLSVTTVAQNVTATTIVRYYACIEDVCSASPATVRIREGTGTPDTTDEPNTPEPTTNTNNAITKLTASPWEPESGTPIIVRFTVQNTDTRTKDITVNVYQHTSRITRPTNGTPVGEMTVESIKPNESITDHVMVTVPTVTGETPVYYHACVGDRCMGPATVTVHAKVAVPTPPYRSCYFSPIRTTSMGGDAAQVRDPNSRYKSCGTITLGGLESVNGTRGFVVSGHVVDIAIDSPTLFTNTEVFFGHGERGGRNPFVGALEIKNFLGKVFRTSSQRVEGDETILVADAAFIAYPYPNTPGCLLTWRDESETFCFELGHGDHVVERVTPFTIRGKGDEVYTVVGSQQPTNGLKVNISGSVTGVSRGREVVGGRMLRHSGIGDFYEYAYAATKSDVIPGDSGSPVFTVPDADGDTHIVGILSGYTDIKGKPVVIFSSWDDVTEALDLKPVAP